MQYKRPKLRAEVTPTNWGQPWPKLQGGVKILAGDWSPTRLVVTLRYVTLCLRSLRYVTVRLDVLNVTPYSLSARAGGAAAPCPL